MIDYKPKILSWPQIWNIAEEFRSEYSNAKKFPVQIEDLIEFELKIDMVPITGLKSEVGVEAFLSKDMREIRVDATAYNNPRYLPRLRFTLAEEVGHFVLHNEIYKQNVSYTSEEEFIKDILDMDENDLAWVERQARQFAGRLLVPLEELESRIEKYSDLVDSLYERYEGGENIEDLAIEGLSKKICVDFGVSWEVICYRISYEKLNNKFIR